MGGNRSAFDQVDEFHNRCGCPFGLAFHFAVVAVADPTRHPKPTSAVEGECAKPYTLNISGNQEMHAAAVAKLTCDPN